MKPTPLSIDSNPLSLSCKSAVSQSLQVDIQTEEETLALKSKHKSDNAHLNYKISPVKSVCETNDQNTRLRAMID